MRIVLTVVSFALAACASTACVAAKCDEPGLSCSGISSLPTIYKVKLVRDYTATYPAELFDEPRAAALFFYRLIGSADREHTAALFFDQINRPMGATIIGIGTLTSVPVQAREVFKAALLASAHSLIISHNHPLGHPSPSENDIRTTHRLVIAGGYLGIRIRDHIIVSPDGSFVSFVEAGLLKKDAA